jgi:hypothetical protein
MNPAYERIYHFHVRKTAGTSLNRAFWGLGGLGDAVMRHPNQVGRRLSGNGLVFVRDDARLIEQGDYFFASSHTPAYMLALPKGTFTVTILRDPAARVVSYYRYLRWARENPTAFDRDPFVSEVVEEGRFLEGGIGYALGQLSRRKLATESAIRQLGAKQFLARLARSTRGVHNFTQFLEAVPPRRLMSQLYMFSARLDPNEAAERLAACDAVCFTESFAEDIAALSKTLDIPLPERRDRRLGDPIELSRSEEDQLREKLEPEYRMLSLLGARRSPGDRLAGSSVR